jgi:hypothetical protein
MISELWIESFGPAKVTNRRKPCPGGGGIGPRVARAAGAQSGGQWRHDQALVGAEFSRVGVRLGPPAFMQAE